MLSELKRQELTDRRAELVLQKDYWDGQKEAIRELNQAELISDPNDSATQKRSENFAIASRQYEKAWVEIVDIDSKLAHDRTQVHEAAEMSKAQHNFVEGQQPVDKGDWLDTMFDEPQKKSTDTPVYDPTPTP